MKGNGKNIDDSVRFVARNYQKGIFDPGWAWQRLEKRMGITPQKRRFASFYWVAAMVVGIIASGVLFFSVERTQKLVAKVDNAVFTLPDNSVVNMKNGSRLEYDKDFGQATRNVKMQGEIVFEVAHDKEKPFIVSTPTATVKVLGTVFNVTGNEQETTLDVSSGKVLFTPADPAISFVCTANMSAQYKVAEKEVSYFSPDFQLSVNAGKNTLKFENATLKDVGSLLSQYFGIPINIPENEKHINFSSTFTHKNIREIVQIINLTLDSHVTIAE